jgi:hypothetical protein
MRCCGFQNLDFDAGALDAELSPVLGVRRGHGAGARKLHGDRKTETQVAAEMQPEAQPKAEAAPEAAETPAEAEAEPAARDMQQIS